MDTNQYSAIGWAYFQLHYVNERGELIHTGRSESTPPSSNPTDALKSMRNEAPRIAEELLRKAPPVKLK